MSKNDNEKKRINPTFLAQDYEEIKLIAEKENKTMAELVRDWALEGKNGVLTKNNIDVLAPIIREQLRDILIPQINRVASISMKAGIQAGAAAYLNAEVLNSLLSPELRQDFSEAYTKARKKSVEYMRNNIEDGNKAK